MTKIISPKYDYSMKELFTNETIRKHFISDVTGIPIGDIRTARLAKTFLWKHYRMKKPGILDVLVELNDDTKVNIELQVSVYRHWDRRNLFYMAKMYTDDLRVGEHYGKLKRCVCISLLDFDFTGNDEYHTDYRLRDRKGKDFTDLFEIHIIELQKELDDTEVADWIRFFNAETKEELDMITPQTPGLLEAIQEVKVMSVRKRLRLGAAAHLKEVRDRKAREDYVREEGRREGIRQGIDQGIRQGIDQGAEQKLLSQIERKIAAGQTEEQIAEDLLEPLDHIRELRGKSMNSNK